MSKDLVSAILTEMAATNKRPVLLFELGLSSTIRFAAYKTNITFPTGGSVYTAKNISVSEVSQSIEGQIGRITVKFDNVSRDMAAYSNIDKFKGKTIVIKRVYLDAVGNILNYNEVFNGIMETPSEVSRQWLTVSATSGKPLYKKALSFAYQRQCPWKFGGLECNTAGLADLTTLKASGTADSGGTDYLIDSALTEANDYWNYGKIIITKDGVAYPRKVKDFIASTDRIELDVELPISVDNTCDYVVYKGCDQLEESCDGSKAWGPSGDNYLNFGGCIHVSSQQDAE